MANSPGTYVVERNNSGRVKGASTSVGAIVIASNQGPVMTRELVTNSSEFIYKFGKPDLTAGYGHYAALNYLKKSSVLYVTRVINDDTSKGALPLSAGLFYSVDKSTDAKPVPHLSNFDDNHGHTRGEYDPYNTFSFNPNDVGIENVLFLIVAENPGEWNQRIYVQVRTSQKGLTNGFDTRYDDPTQFYVDIFLDYTSPKQTPDESFLVSCSKVVDGNGKQLYIEDVINGQSNLVRVLANPYATKKVPVYTTTGNYMEGGTNGHFVSYSQMMRGWDLYKDTESISVNILIQGGQPAGMNNPTDIADVQRHMLSIAEYRMDSTAVLDVPDELQETADAVAYIKGDLNVDSSYGAIYSPSVKVLDTYNDKYVWLPPSCFVAPNYADTDANYAVWFDPAGMYRGTVLCDEARFIYNKGHRNVLHANRINAIRFFPKGDGYKVWDAITLAVEASALSNVAVRRLLNYLETSISDTVDFSVFDPNDSILWSRLVAKCNAFLKPIADAQGLYWFKVICDTTNNKPSTIASGDLYLDCYFDPVICAKRIHMRAHILKTGATFKEAAV